jgi:hypothetical protein
MVFTNASFCGILINPHPKKILGIFIWGNQKYKYIKPCIPRRAEVPDRQRQEDAVIRE